MIYYSKKHKTLHDIIFDKFDSIEYDEFIVLSGWLGPKPIEDLLELNINSKIIYGLAASEGVTSRFHEKILSYLGHSVDIYVPKIPSHAKVYLWKLNGKVIYALNGSANFSGSLMKPYLEVLNEVNLSSFAEFDHYVNTIFESSIEYDKFDFSKTKSRIDVSNSQICESPSLYAEKSNINWGHGSAHTNPRDAYISINKSMINNYPSLFPEKSPLKGLGLNDNEPIEVIWDDGTTMMCLLEGTIFENRHQLNEKRYPNKISSYKNKKILGDYLRKRLNVGEGKFVTKEAFKNYGRDTISISKISNETYFFDFSSSKT
jgi:hypothetical protein